MNGSDVGDLYGAKIESFISGIHSAKVGGKSSVNANNQSKGEGSVLH